MNSKSKKLLSNTIIFFVGSLGSKLFQFLLIPLYTYTLSTNEFGVADLVFTTINFLIPFFSVQLSDGLLRFGLDKKYDQSDVIACSFRILFIGSFCSILLSPLFSFSSILKTWLLYFLIILNLRIYKDIFSIILKIEEKNKLYAIDSILYTFVLCISSAVFLLYLKLGIKGYFISYIIANIFSIIFIFFVSKIQIKTFFKRIDFTLCRKLLLYSSPLIVNSLSYWITTASDRYMINWYLGEGSVGLYAIAAKIPTILTTLTGIFSQAWLISSISEYENDNDSGFYSHTFVNYCQFSLIICSFLILFINPFMKFYVSSNYYVSWIYSPLLILSAVFSGVCSFLNGIYYAYKKVFLTTITTIIGAILNIAVNLLLIPIIGIMGATISTVLSWFIIMILKIILMNKFYKLKVNYFPFLLSILLIVIQILFIMFLSESIITYIFCSLLLFIIVFFNRSIVLKFLFIIKDFLIKFNSKLIRS